MEKEYKKQATFTLSPRVVEKLEKLAYENCTNKSQVITNLILNAKLKDKEKEEHYE